MQGQFARLTWLALPVFALVAIALVVVPQQYSLAQGDTNDCAPRRLTAGWPDTDWCTSSVDFDEVISGGPGKDGIPAITDPEMQTLDEASEWLTERSPVIAVEIGDEARAYPQAILMWHEIANDEVAGVPVAVTYCPLCNSSIVFDRRFETGEDTRMVLEFGVSGYLRKSDMVMYDRNTDSLWQQFTGEGIVGQFTGELLDIIPSQVIGFAQFAQRYPDGLVMSRDTGVSRSYGRNPYVNYDTSGPYRGLFNEATDDRLPAVEHVLAGEIGGEAIAYPFSALSEEIVINDTVGEQPVVALWQPGSNSAMDASNIDNSRDVGTAALFSRDVDGQTLTFTVADDGTITDEQTGSTWNLFGEAISGELEGTELEQLVAAPHFWFAWAAFKPDTAIYGA